MTKGTQRWMKLRTTVQLSGAITSTIQKSKTPLKREDSFLKRFSTRQIPELEDTVDTGEDTGQSTNCEPGGAASLSKKHTSRRKYSQQTYTVVNPDGSFFFYWLLVVSICVLYNLWTLIVRQAFPELQENLNRFWISCDILSDVVFLLDICVQLRTGYLEQGLMVYDTKKLAGHYVKSKKFVMDLLAMFPLEIAQVTLGVKPILRFPRFLKLYRVYTYYYIVESRTVYPNLWRVVNLIHILLILAHWFGCFYFLLSEAEGFQGDWVYPYRPGEYATLGRKYLGSLYWSTLTLTTIGDLPTPETNIEYLFTIVSYLIGVFIFATIVGQVGNVITNRNANRLEFERLLDGAKTYMRHHKVPGGMKRRVLRWYDYSWSRGRIQGGGDINTALGLLPDKLKTELALHVNLSVLKKVTIFQECQPEFLHDLVLKMKAYIFTPGDMICRKGEVAREMFIIADGILEVMSETGRVLTTMKAGDFFGEIGILNLDGLNKRTADVRSVGYSELFSLSREDVLTAMKDYPEAQEILQTLGRKRLMEARTLNRAWKISAQQKKEKNANTAQPPKLDKSDAEPEVSNKNRIVEKIRGDVKELRNVFKKNSRTARAKSDCLELDVTKFQEREKIKTISQKVALSRSPCVYDGDISHDEDSQPSQKVIGAGLPLIQRLKLLKEKQELENKNSGDSVTSVPSTNDRKEVDPGLPLLQRILLLKQKEEKKCGVVQNTANLAAEVLASTVRTQQKSPTKQLILKRSLKNEEDTRCKLSEKKDDIQKKNLFKKNKNKSLELDIPLRDSNSEKDSCKKEKEISKKNLSECDNESWTLIKKAVLDTNNSVDIHEKVIEPKNIDDSQSSNNVELANFSRVKALSVINSVTESSSGENSLNQKAEKKFACRPTENSQKLVPADLNSKTYIERDKYYSDGEVMQRKVSLGKSNASGVYKRQKIYHSIDDLSPEYSGLPFVKKLKILNERQKLAELQNDLPWMSGNIKGLTSSISNEFQAIQGSEEFNHKISLRKEKPLPILIKNETETAEVETVGASGHKSVDKQYPRPKSESSIDYKMKDVDLPLLSPESNETLERRKLKSILKKLSTASVNPSSSVHNQYNLDGDQNASDIRKLLRAPTVEGYAARHSKFTKTVTLNQDIGRPVKTTVDSSFTESISIADETVNSAQSSMDTSLYRTKYSAWTDSSRSVDDSLLTEISTLDNGIPAPIHEEIVDNINICSTEKASIDTDERTFQWNLFKPAMDGTGRKSMESRNPVASEAFTPDFNYTPNELFSHLFKEIKKAIDDHMDKIELNFMNKYVSLDYECKRRGEIITELENKIAELQREENTGLMYPLSREDRCSFELEARNMSRIDEHGTVRTGEGSASTSQHDSFVLPIDDVDSTESDSDVFYEDPSRNNWEIHLLAEELEKREEAMRRRAVSFDFSQLQAKRRQEGGQENPLLGPEGRWSGTDETLLQKELTRRSVSINNIEGREYGSRDRRYNNVSFNGVYSRNIHPSYIRKTQSFMGD